MPSLRTARPVLALAAGVLLATVGAGAAFAQSPDASVDPSTPVVGVPDDGAIPVVPDPTVTGEQPVGWDHITVGPDGRTLTVYFWNGAQECYGLKDVQVEMVDGVPSITLMTGMQADAIAKICIEIAQLYSTQVVLDEPILLGGALG
jgi:hypothetical protein